MKNSWINKYLCGALFALVVSVLGPGSAQAANWWVAFDPDQPGLWRSDFNENVTHVNAPTQWDQGRAGGSFGWIVGAGQWLDMHATQKLHGGSYPHCQVTVWLRARNVGLAIAASITLVDRASGAILAYKEVRPQDAGEGVWKRYTTTYYRPTTSVSEVTLRIGFFGNQRADLSFDDAEVACFTL